MNYPNPSGPDRSNPKDVPDNPEMFRKIIGRHNFELNLGTYADVPDIDLGDRTYKFITNIGLPRKSDLERVIDESIPARERKYVQRDIDSATNMTSYFQEITRRGFGIIPDPNNEDNSWDNLRYQTISFYQDAALPANTSLELQKAIEDRFPKNHNPFYDGYDGPLGILSKSEIAGYLDETLSEERFALALEHSQKHLKSLGE